MKKDRQYLDYSVLYRIPAGAILRCTVRGRDSAEARVMAKRYYGTNIKIISAKAKKQ